MAYQLILTKTLLLASCLLLGNFTAFSQGEQAEETTAESIVQDEPATSAAGDAAGGVAAGAGDYAKGKSLWNANVCGSCHNKNMKDDATGPALGGVQERWAGEPREHLYRWVQQSQALIASGESQRALAVWSKWKPTVMSNYTNLSNEDVEHLLAFIRGQYTGEGIPATAGVAGEVVQVGEEADNTWIFVILGVSLLLLSFILARVTSNMRYRVAAEQGDAPERRTLVDVMTSKGVIAFVVFAAVVLGGYTTVNHAIELGRQQEYQPEQPIKFSHVTHSGLNKIECQYCHDGARRSKHSVIPAVNTCMNCHRAIKVGSQYGTAELTKIFASIGYDPKQDAYIEDYENLPNDEIKSIYRSWILENLQKEYEDPAQIDFDEVEEEADRQLDALEDALTNDYTGDDKIAGPVEWVRIHNLPDHAYFNHAQHVTVGKLRCQNCHGPVEEMELVYQYSPLSMGWCINCHRQSEVRFKENDYYKAYERYHNEIKDGVREAVTVEDVGGLNCQRCHY